MRDGSRNDRFKNYVASVKDFPKKGIIFRDITTLMNDGEAYKYATEQIVQFAKDKQVDLVVGPELEDLYLDVQFLML